MIERATPRFGRLVFDRDAIVRAALRAYVEGCLERIARFGFPCIDYVGWTGDLKRGSVRQDDGEGNYEVVAWTEAGVVGLAYELGWGPIEQLRLSVDAVTGGPDDVRGAVPGLPAELEPAFVLAVGRLDVGPEHGQRDAGVGFWLHGDRVGGTLFDDPMPSGARRLAAWGLLHNGRLLPLSCESYRPRPGGIVTAFVEPKAVPAHAVMDAVTDRALSGPTEFTPAELDTLLQPAPDPKQLLAIQRGLRKVGITWPGSPELPPETPRPKGPDPFLPPPTKVFRTHPLDYIGILGFDRDTIVRAALRAYVEVLLARLDPRGRHPFPPCADPNWTGDLQRGAFYNGDGYGDYDVVAWTEAGIIGLTYQVGFGPLEQLGLSASAVTGGPDDVRAALPGLPAELSPALVMAVSLLDVGPHGEKLAGVGFWLHGDRVAGTLFDNPSAPGVPELALWGSLGADRLRLRDRLAKRATTGPEAATLQKLVDAVVARALAGPTELLTDELAMLLPTPPDPERLLAAQRMLQKVGITWPGSPELPEEPRRAGANR